MIFWDSVKSTLSGKNLTLKGLSEKTGLNYRTLQNQIGRSIEPSVSDAYKIAQSLGVTIETLLTGEEPVITRNDVLSYLEKNLS